ncbi:UDP-N-acetylmuramoyl-tripeptide--D-alanyl-D-alanine ligase [hydrothermal vent metagenome]|uniref:UDP-MurNAc-pentapeptide synthetase n=1 Tax=hydrothermal vent metagenome TaxID=652676 RepID=A0A3B1DIK5_9ZZZZ
MRRGEFWTAESVRTAIGGSWVQRSDAQPALVGGAAIDTRALNPGEVFFALRGEQTDGHRYLRHAHEAGAALAIIDDVEAAGELPAGLGVLRVGNARLALGRLAGAYRATLGSVRTIAVTGSNGKTTTTRMIDACLRTALRGHCSPKSYNNDLGVPLTVLGAQPGGQYLLCEVGANDPGEIEPLSRIVRPHVVVITSIGSAHLEGFGTLEAIAAEKASLAAHLEPGGLVVLSADAPELALWRDRFERVLTFGTSPEADLRVSHIEQGPTELIFLLNERESFSVPMLGEHNACNAAAAIAVARRVGVADEAIREALAGCTPPAMRLSRENIGGIEIINDAYNANPDSMLAALRTLRDMAPPGSRRVAVLGDMLELGEAGPDAHRQIGREIAVEHLADVVVLVGPLAALAGETLRVSGIEVVAIEDLPDSGVAGVASVCEPGDTVLLKGSRSIGLERVVEAFRLSGTEASNPGGRG